MQISRRDALKVLGAGSLGLAGCSLPEIGSPKAEPARMPAVFISHGSPMVSILKNAYTKSLRRMGEETPLPKAIVVVSAHWMDEAPIRVTGSERPGMIYDFGGFPDELYQIKYPSPGHPALAAEIAKLLTDAGQPARLDPDRGLDHGAWVPMRLAYPGADIPVLEVTLTPAMTPEDYFKMGRALAPLRSRGILLVGSGGITHNFSKMDPDDQADPDNWARTFDTWVRGRLQKKDHGSLLKYRTAHKYGELAAPTTEHFDPLFFILGAAHPRDEVRDIYEGIQSGSLSLRTFQLK